MKKIIFISVILSVSIFTSCSNSSNHNNTVKKPEANSEMSAYICPMDSDVTSDKPGKCPKCGMDLVKKTK
jgi:hypothetical protein